MHALAHSLARASVAPPRVFASSASRSRSQPRARAGRSQDKSAPPVATKPPFTRRGVVAGTAALIATRVRSAPPARAEGETFADGPDGIRYADLKVGTGAEPFEGDVLKVNYQLDVDGKKVDFAKFFVFSGGSGEVIKGWDMAVMGSGSMPPMKVGGTRKALIPPELAYGAKGAGCAGNGECRIPPDSVLEFSIELVGIKGM